MQSDRQIDECSPIDRLTKSISIVSSGGINRGLMF